LEDVPAWGVTPGDTAPPEDLGVEGLKRRGFEKADIRVLRNAYKSIYRKGLTLDEALMELKAMTSESSAVQLLIDSLEQSTRGIIR